MSRTPISVLYGGAHLFNAATPKKVGDVALAVLDRHAPSAEAFATLCAIEVLPEAQREAVYLRVRSKLEREPIEDFRIDFEDGYGIRSPAEEDAHAEGAARALLVLERPPPFVGLRIKAMTASSRPRAARTLSLFLSALEGRWQGPLVVTVPKIEHVEEAEAFAALVDRAASDHRVELVTELMIETRSALGAIEALCAAAGPRLASVHFGAYDFLSELGVAADAQALSHPLCDTARHTLKLKAPVRVADGATHLLPVGDDAARVVRHMRLHAEHVRHALDTGISQGWDLHPAQLVARYAATYAYFIRSRDAAASRLARFIRDAAKARADGGVFDDAATALGLINFFIHGLDSGALDESDLAAAGVDAASLRLRSFDALAQKVS